MDRSRIEIYVGLFVLAGLCAAAVLIVQFGRSGRALSGSYALKVQFPNASGLVDGAQVRYRGALVGRVQGEPYLLKDDSGIEMVVQLQPGLTLPVESRFTIGKSGLLGDSYIDVLPPRPTETRSGKAFANGETVKGTGSGGLNDLTNEGTDLLATMKVVAQRLDNISRKLDEALTPETLADAQASVSHMRDSLQRVDRVLKEIEDGQGPIGVLMYDRETAENIKALVYNLRKKGVVFYGDVYEKDHGSEKSEPSRKKPSASPSKRR